MQVARVDGAGSIWYATALSSNKVSQARLDAQVCLAIWADGRHRRVFGRAEIITDATVKHRLWDDSWRTYSRGEDDPGHMLLKVAPERADQAVFSRIAGVLCRGAALQLGDAAQRAPHGRR